jgi:uncharacterized protein YecE (DUF72 family)
MSKILVGTASWTDKTLLDSGWYPPEANDATKRLGYYATRFPLVEVDATYYHPPAEATAAAWTDRTPDDFVFNIKAFSLLTGHPTKTSAIFKDLRPETDKANIYPDDLPPQAYEEVWTRFLSSLDPLVAAKKLGAILFQFPPWFGIKKANKQYLIEVAKRCSPLRAVIELRNESWFAGENQAETLTFLEQHHLPFVSVDMPQGYKSSIPPVLVATSDLAVVRFHGHSEKWTSKNIYEKYGYDYSTAELKKWAPKLEKLSREASQLHVLMNNCRGDASQRNAAELRKLLDVRVRPCTAVPIHRPHSCGRT